MILRKHLIIIVPCIFAYVLAAPLNQPVEQTNNENRDAVVKAPIGNSENIPVPTPQQDQQQPPVQEKQEQEQQPPPQQQQQQQIQIEDEPVVTVAKEHHNVQERSPVRKIENENHPAPDDQQQNMQARPPTHPSMQTLYNDSRCHNDLDNLVNRKGLCSKDALQSNILILDCLQNNLNEESEQLLSEDCHHAIWDLKGQLTKDQAVHEAIQSQCGDIIKELPECSQISDRPGHLTDCLIQHSDQVHDFAPPEGNGEDVEKFKNCNSLLTRLSSIVFSDYRMVHKFLEHCDDEIDQFKCGRATSVHNKERLTSQDETIGCLRGHFKEVQNKQCRHEMLRLAELQADDYHLNRGLYLSCREDRERFCAKVIAGQGRVYQCLIEHKTDNRMSKECKDQLITEQEMAQEDFKVDVNFARKCNADLQKSNCIPPAPSNGQQLSNEVIMSQIIHCLVSVERDQEGSISSECMGAVHGVARQIMEDFKISPLIVSGCKDEIATYCDNQLTRDGQTLQCLLMHARTAGKNNHVRFTQLCMSELQEILEEADVASDYTVDPMLVKYCSPIIEANCKEFKHSGGAILGCLLEHLGTPALQDHPDCGERVLALYYFISRNWRLDKTVYKSCRQPAIDFCRKFIFISCLL